MGISVTDHLKEKPEKFSNTIRTEMSRPEKNVKHSQLGSTTAVGRSLKSNMGSQYSSKGLSSYSKKKTVKQEPTVKTMSAMLQRNKLVTKPTKVKQAKPAVPQTAKKQRPSALYNDFRAETAQSRFAKSRKRSESRHHSGSQTRASVRMSLVLSGVLTAQGSVAKVPSGMTFPQSSILNTLSKPRR